MVEKAYIIIVSYNSMQWLPKCLDSAKTYPVVIVDNLSTDGTIEFIKKKHSKVKLFEKEKNLGFGQANNIGISYALSQGADYVFLLNQDAYLEPGSIEKLIEVQKKKQEYGILSPLHLNGEGDRLDKNFSNYLNYQGNPDFYSDYVLNKPKKEIYDVPFVNAAGWLLSKHCIEKVGGFDPIFFHYGEDDNYCQRVIYNGFKIGVFPLVRLKHDRATRKTTKIESGTKDYFDEKAKLLKIRYGDINKPYKNNLLKLSKKRKKAYRKSQLRLNFKIARFYKRESEMLRTVHDEILASRNINKKTFDLGGGSVNYKWILWRCG